MSTIDARQIHALSVLAPRLSARSYLAGGVAIGLHVGHRPSRDLDLFTPDEKLLRSRDALVEP